MIKTRGEKNTIPFSTAVFAEVPVESKNLQSTKRKNLIMLRIVITILN